MFRSHHHSFMHSFNVYLLTSIRHMQHATCIYQSNCSSERLNGLNAASSLFFWFDINCQLVKLHRLKQITERAPCIPHNCSNSPPFDPLKCMSAHFHFIPCSRGTERRNGNQQCTITWPKRTV